MREKTVEKPRKAKLGVYLDPRLARRLKHERAETDISVSSLIERIVAAYYGVEFPELEPDAS